MQTRARGGLKKIRLLLLLFSGITCMCIPLGAAADDVGEIRELRLLIRNDISCNCQSADIYQPLAESIDRFAETYNVHVVLQQFSSPFYQEQLFRGFNSEFAPHVIWAEAPLLPMLVRHDLVIPLGKSETDPEGEDLFTFKEQLYGLPLGPEGELLLNGYMVTRVAEKDGLADLARALIDNLRQEIPLRGLPDLAVQSVSVKRQGPGKRSFGKWSRRGPARAMITATISNLGEAEADRAAVTMQYGRQIQTRYVRNLEVGNSRKVKFRVILDEHEPEPLVLTVDSLDELNEDNEVNNVVTEMLVDIPSLPGPSLFPPTPAAQGAPFVIDLQAYTTSSRGMGPRVAFDGQNYLVVWARQPVLDPTGYNHELRAARIQPDGTILDPDGFVIQAGPGLFRRVEVAHDGNNTFLVVWERDQVYFDQLAAPTSVIEGARVSNNGSVYVSNPVVIENSTTPAAYNRIGHSSPDVFFDGNDFRVIYQSMVQYTDDLNDIVDAQSGIYMKRVQPLSGNGTDKQALVTYGSNVVGWDPKVTYSQGKGLLIFNGLTGHDTTTGDPAIWSRWFTLSGGLNLSLLLPVVTDNSGLWNVPFQDPVVAGAEPDYVSVWSDLTVIGADNDKALSGASGLSIQGTSTGWVVPTGSVLQACNDEDPRVSFNGSEFTVVDRHQHGCHSYVGVVNLDLDATPGFYDFLDFGGEPNLIHEPDVTFGTTNGLAVFNHQNYPSNYNGMFPTYGIWGVFLNSGSSSP